MDHQFYRPMPDRHSKHMENLSLIMGIIALSTFCLVYPALICGALGIVFALLSRFRSLRNIDHAVTSRK